MGNNTKSLTAWLKAYPKNDVVKKAYEFAKNVHKNSRRITGEPFIEHCLSVAKMVHGWGLDRPTVAAALLHDVVEDTDKTIEDIRKNFGEEIAFLVSGLTKLKNLKYTGKKQQAENMRKLVVSTSEDLRVMFIKLADRWHNMQSLGAMPLKTQKIKAEETEDIYAPLAYRLGMQWLSGELNDLAFPFIYPDEYKWLLKSLGGQYEEGERYAKKVKPIIEKTLKKEGILPVEIDARAKRYSSLYKKLLRYDMDIGKIYDLVALRIIVKSIEECYMALGVIHKHWPPLPGRIKDYIALPKPNGYKSIHTTVFCVDNRIIEIQIRTEEMHQEAEMGAAAHWAYAQAKNTEDHYRKKSQNVEADKNELLWVKQLRSWQEQFKEPDDFMDSLKVDFFKERIFVVTPENDVLDLPAGSTPIDFAYRIHSEIGNQCAGAKVNGKIVSLDQELKSGDVVEILIQKNKRPSESWLSFAKTSVARGKIKSAIKKKKIAFFGKAPEGVEFKISAQNRTGLLKDVGEIFSRSKTSISAITSTANKNDDQYSTMIIKCKELPQQKIEKLLLKIKQIPDVKEVSYRHTR